MEWKIRDARSDDAAACFHPAMLGGGPKQIRLDRAWQSRPITDGNEERLFGAARLPNMLSQKQEHIRGLTAVHKGTIMKFTEGASATGARTFRLCH